MLKDEAIVAVLMAVSPFCVLSSLFVMWNLIRVPSQLADEDRGHTDELASCVKKLNDKYTSDVELLVELAQQSRAIPGEARLADGDGRIDAATIAGRLVEQAMQYGLFSEPTYATLKARITMSLNGEYTYQRDECGEGISRPAPLWHAFINVVPWFWKRDGVEYHSFNADTVTDGCRIIADEIDGLVETKKKLAGHADQLTREAG